MAPNRRHNLRVNVIEGHRHSALGPGKDQAPFIDAEMEMAVQPKTDGRTRGAYKYLALIRMLSHAIFRKGKVARLVSHLKKCSSMDQDRPIRMKLRVGLRQLTVMHRGGKVERGPLYGLVKRLIAPCRKRRRRAERTILTPRV